MKNIFYAYKDISTFFVIIINYVIIKQFKLNMWKVENNIWKKIKFAFIISLKFRESL